MSSPLCTACLRFAHLQRSVNLRCENSLLSALCILRGSSKEYSNLRVCQLVRHHTHVSIAPTLLLEHGELCVSKPDASFVIPDLQLPRSGRLEPSAP